MQNPELDENKENLNDEPKVENQEEQKQEKCGGGSCFKDACEKLSGRMEDCLAKLDKDAISITAGNFMLMLTKQLLISQFECLEHRRKIACLEAKNQALWDAVEKNEDILPGLREAAVTSVNNVVDVIVEKGLYAEIAYDKECPAVMDAISDAFRR